MSQLRWASERLPKGIVTTYKVGLRAAVVCAVLALIVLSTLPGELRPKTSLGGLLEHFTAYALTAFLLPVAFGERLSIVQTSLALPALALVLEIAQGWIPARVPSTVDFAAGVVGAANGGLLGWMLRNILNPRREPITPGTN